MHGQLGFFFSDKIGFVFQVICLWFVLLNFPCFENGQYIWATVYSDKKAILRSFFFSDKISFAFQVICLVFDLLYSRCFEKGQYIWATVYSDKKPI